MCSFPGVFFQRTKSKTITGCKCKCNFRLTINNSKQKKKARVIHLVVMFTGVFPLSLSSCRCPSRYSPPSGPYTSSKACNRKHTSTDHPPQRLNAKSLCFTVGEGGKQRAGKDQAIDFGHPPRPRTWAGGTMTFSCCLPIFWVFWNHQLLYNKGVRLYA